MVRSATAMPHYADPNLAQVVGLHSWSLSCGCVPLTSVSQRALRLASWSYSALPLPRELCYLHALLISFFIAYNPTAQDFEAEGL